MPASDSEFHDAFESYIGTDGPQEIYPGHEAMGWEGWSVLFSETGIDFESSAETIDAFENFLQAFYPQTGADGEYWDSVRGEFYELYDVDESNIDWEAWRESMGY